MVKMLLKQIILKGGILWIQIELDFYKDSGNTDY